MRAFLLSHLRRLRMQPPSGRLFPRCWRTQRASPSQTLLTLTQLLTLNPSVKTLTRRCVSLSFTRSCVACGWRVFASVVLKCLCIKWNFYNNKTCPVISQPNCQCPLFFGLLLILVCLKTADFPIFKTALSDLF